MKLSRPLLVWCVLWILFIAIAYSNAGSGMGLFLICYSITIVWAVAWMMRFLPYVWSVMRKETRERSGGIVYWALEPFTFALAIAIAVSGVSSHVRFVASKSALTDYVTSVSASETHSEQRVGLYTLKETEVLPNGVVRIITTESGFDDAGFAFSPRSAPPVIGEDSYKKLPFSDGWYHWHRSW